MRKLYCLLFGYFPGTLSQHDFGLQFVFGYNRLIMAEQHTAEVIQKKIRFPQTFFTSRWYWLLKGSIAKFFAPDRVIFRDNHLEIIRPFDPFFIQVHREMLRYDRIASYSVHTGIFWCSLDVDDLGSEGPTDFLMVGFPRSYAQKLHEIMQSIEDLVRERYGKKVLRDIELPRRHGE